MAGLKTGGWSLNARSAVRWMVARSTANACDNDVQRQLGRRRTAPLALLGFHAGYASLAHHCGMKDAGRDFQPVSGGQTHLFAVGPN